MFRRNPELFHEIFASIQEVVWVYDPANDRFEYVSPSYTTTWRRPDGPLPTVAADWLATVHPDDGNRVRQAHEGLSQTGTFQITFRIITPDGGVRWIANRASVIGADDGRVTRIFGIAQDITEQRHLEEQLRQAQKMESMGQLASGVAHDFNNWLTVILGYVELLGAMVEDDAVGVKYVDEIRRASERASGLTRQLLAFSRKEVLEPREVHFNGLIADTQRMLQRLLGDDIVLDATLGAEVGYVHVDPTQWVQVLTNLAVNARDAMPTGGRLSIATTAVTIESRRRGASPSVVPGRFVCLAVADSGCGMSEAVAMQAFEPFFTTKPAGKGTGLGLAVVASVVDAAGGFIEVESALGRGTTFRLYLPASDRAHAGPDQRGATPDGAGECVLVVDDEASLREVACFTLKDHGYRVYTASNGDEALAVLRLHGGEIDVLFTDVVMPGTGGRALVEAVAADWPHVRVIYTTGYTDDAVVRYGIAQEEVAFLHKPYTPQQLLATIRTVLAAPS